MVGSEKIKYSYFCGKCGKPKRESEMYKVTPPSLCLSCFELNPKVRRFIYGWTKDGWDLISIEVIPEDIYRRRDYSAEGFSE